MTREELIEATRAIARVLTEEIDRPGENEHRYRALKRAEAMTLSALEQAESPAPECPYCGTTHGLRVSSEGCGSVAPDYICADCFTGTDTGPCFDDLPAA